MINFLSRQFCPQLLVDKPCADGHNADNLISFENASNTKGFYVEPYIKPPVTISIFFPFNVNLSQIIIGTKVGWSLKSTAFQIYSENRKLTGTSFLQNADSQSIQTSFKPIYLGGRVCIGRSENTETDVIVFRNCNYNSIYNFSFCTLNSHLNQTKDYGECNLSSNSRSFLSNVSALFIKIMKTKNSCPPAMSFLEIWGQPSNFCPLTVISKVESIYHNLELKKQHTLICLDQDCPDFTRNASTTVLPHCQAICNISECTIPEDFLDPITLEIMSMPILLPSGKTVDSLTLQKYSNSEANKGRQPNDPFTGVVFTQTNKPVFNEGLKSRLDIFLTENSEKLKDVPRSLGRWKKCSTDSTSNEDETQNYLRKTNVMSSNIEQQFEGITNACKASNKRTYLNCFETSEEKAKINKYAKIDPIPRISSFDCNSSSSVSPTFECQYDNPDVTSVTIESNLDSCLKNVLKGLPSFTKAAAVQSGDVPKNICCVCSEAYHGKLYSLECYHILCRSCVHKTNKGDVCSKCSVLINKSNISKLQV